MDRLGNSTRPQSQGRQLWLWGSRVDELLPTDRGHFKIDHIEVDVKRNHLFSDASQHTGIRVRDFKYNWFSSSKWREKTSFIHWLLQICRQSDFLCYANMVKPISI